MPDLHASDWIALGAVAVGVATWVGDRTVQRRTERGLRTALYVNPFLFAAHDLQSRLYNVLDRDGLSALRTRHPGGAHAEEVLYLVARYFAFEQILLRFTPLGADPKVMRGCRAVRRQFSTGAGGIDDWCLFRQGQAGLGQAVLKWEQGEHGFPDTRSLPEFRAWLAAGGAAELNVTPALDVLRAAERTDDLPARTRQRLGDVQGRIVDLLEVVERRVRRWPRFTVADEPRVRSTYRRAS